MSRLDRVITHGTFSIDGEDFEVDNNIWIVGDDDECLVIDAAHEAAPIVIHPDDRMLWDVVYPDRAPDGAIADGDRFEAGGVELVALHTPGHSPGGVSLHDATHTRVFSGDTLFKGGPGATGRSFSDRPTIVRSIRTRLFTLPPETVVHTGHGDDTRIADELADLAD